MQTSEKLESAQTQTSFKKKMVTHHQKDKIVLYAILYMWALQM